MTERVPCPSAPGPLEGYAAQFDPLFSTLAQRRGFREYLQGLLLPRDRNKTLTALVGAEPVVAAQTGRCPALTVLPVRVDVGSGGDQYPSTGVVAQRSSHRPAR